MFRTCLGRGICSEHVWGIEASSEPINLEVFVPHKRSGEEIGKYERELGDMRREIAEMKNEN